MKDRIETARRAVVRDSMQKPRIRVKALESKTKQLRPQ